MKIVKAADAFNKSAKIYQDKFMDVSCYGELLNTFCDQITADNARILDIACGPGNITKYLLNKRPDFKVLGIDLSSKMLELAQANNPTARFQLMDCRQIDTIGEKFDAVTCGFCLPYLTAEEALELIANVPGILKPGGVFYLSTMKEDDNNKSRYQISSTGDKVWVNYHQQAYLTQAFQEHNFEVIALRDFTSADNDGLKTSDLILIGKL